MENQEILNRLEKIIKENEQSIDKNNDGTNYSLKEFLFLILAFYIKYSTKNF